MGHRRKKQTDSSFFWPKPGSRKQPIFRIDAKNYESEKMLFDTASVKKMILAALCQRVGRSLETVRSSLYQNER
jgi:hypothetical protein